MTVKHTHPDYPDENARKQQISTVYRELCRLLRDTPSDETVGPSKNKGGKRHTLN